MENPNYEQIVKDAAKWLDGFVPGWWRNIDQEILELNSCSACVLGQLYGDFDAADRMLVRVKGEYSTKGHWRAFCPGHIGGTGLANKLWHSEISARLEADKQQAAKSADAFIARTSEIINQPAKVWEEPTRA